MRSWQLTCTKCTCLHRFPVPEVSGALYSTDMRMPSIHSLSFGLALLPSFLVGCSSDGANGSNASTETTSGEATTGTTSGVTTSASNGSGVDHGTTGAPSVGTSGSPSTAGGTGSNGGNGSTSGAGASGGTDSDGTGGGESAGDSSDTSSVGTSSTGGSNTSTGAESASQSTAGGGTNTAPGTPSLDTLEPNTDCGVEVTAATSETIGTVGIITLTTDVGALDGGYIDFGKDTTYGMRAPLNLGETGYRTLLLGMSQGSEYHYRIVLKSGDNVCASADAVITTGSAPEGVPSVTFSALQPDKVAPGFLVTSTLNLGGGGGGGGGGSGNYALIYNHLGELVWWREVSIGAASRAAISHDTKYMYVRDANPGGQVGGKAARITMDGSVEEVLDVPRGHHDLCIVPDGVLFLSGGGTDSCGEIVKMADDGALSTIYDIREAFGDTFQAGSNDPCHCNSIHYNAEDESISVSCLTQNAYFKIGTDGELKWRLGGNGSQSQFAGDIEWNRQHGHHMVTPNRIVFFNNNGLTQGAGGGASLAVQLDLDLENMTATRSRAYDGGHSSMTFGDAQVLDNENLLVTYCNDGFIREVDTDDEAVAEWTFTGGVGYALQRPSLYGLPPRF